MKCRLCGFEIDEHQSSQHCGCCGSKNCSLKNCPNCGHNNLSELNSEYFQIYSSVKSVLNLLKKRLIKFYNSN